MATREEELSDLTNRELKAILAEENLDTNGNKQALVERIMRFEMGLPEPAPEEPAEEAVEDGEAAAPDADDVDTPSEEAAPAAEETDDVNDSEPTVEAAEAEEDELCLVKFTGKSPMYQREGYTFSVQHPYVAVPASVCDKLVADRPRHFRTATPNEVKRFYDQ